MAQNNSNFTQILGSHKFDAYTPSVVLVRPKREIEFKTRLIRFINRKYLFVLWHNCPKGLLTWNIVIENGFTLHC